METLTKIKKSIIVTIWMLLLTFPIVVIKVNTVENKIYFRWLNLLYVLAGTFVIALIWINALESKKRESKEIKILSLVKSLFFLNEKHRNFFKLLVILSFFIFPFISNLYYINVVTSALIYIMLALGLNIVVGLGGLLNLGHVAFFAVGAYSYALLNKHFGINFWIALPIAGALSFIFGLIIGFPVLRLKGDYLAIVTLAFGEITRIILENWNDFSFGPSGISNIPKPSFFIKLNLEQNAILIYFILLFFVILTIFVVHRLENSRIGRRWIAMREDEIACQSVGINITKAKLLAFSLGALWAGFAGVIFAAKTTFINPASFTIWESIIILCIVVLGGMGSISGVVIATFILIILPEFLRFFSEYRMLIFGALLVIMMIFRPGGIVNAKRKIYIYK